MNLPLDRFCGKTMMVSGATGLIGSFLIDLIMRLNQEKHLNCQVIAAWPAIRKKRKNDLNIGGSRIHLSMWYANINQPLTELDDKVDICSILPAIRIR